MKQAKQFKEWADWMVGKEVYYVSDHDGAIVRGEVTRHSRDSYITKIYAKWDHDMNRELWMEIDRVFFEDYPEEPFLTLSLSEDEAETLRAILGKVGGCPENSPRKYMERVWSELESVTEGRFIKNLYSERSLYFSNFPERKEMTLAEIEKKLGHPVKLIL